MPAPLPGYAPPPPPPTAVNELNVELPPLVPFVPGLPADAPPAPTVTGYGVPAETGKVAAYNTPPPPPPPPTSQPVPPPPATTSTSTLVTPVGAVQLPGLENDCTLETIDGLWTCVPIAIVKESVLVIVVFFKVAILFAL